jgi:hypothetical protein
MQFCVTRVILRDLAALVPQIFHSLHKITHFLTGYIISYFIPKFNFLLRTTPFWKFSNYVNSIDSSLKSSLARILNLRLTDLQWCQSTLPIRFGGLGIRPISDICLPAFLSSIQFYY